MCKKPWLALVAWALLGAAQDAAASFAPCTTEEGPPGALCRRVRVPEDRKAPAGRSLDLFVVRIPASGSDPAPDPVFYLAGGPGEEASETALELPEILAVLHPRHDLFFVDQRGTGRSHPLPCASAGEPCAEAERRPPFVLR